MIVRIKMDIGKYLGIAEMSVFNDDGSRMVYKGKPCIRQYSVSFKAGDSLNLKELMTLRGGLKKLKPLPELKVLIEKPGQYIRIGLNSLDKWQQSEWLTAKGKPVKYMEEWKEVNEMIKAYKVVEIEKGEE